jgi:RNA polymerase sigma factor (sigma-70 family)
MEALTTLVRRAQHGEVEAFGLLVERFQRMACAVAYRMVGDPHLAEDVAQEAFLEAYRCLPQLREPAAFPAWFRRVVLKYADRQVRGRQHSWVSLDGVSELASAIPDPVLLAEQAETRRMLHVALAGLTEPERTLVSLFHLEGYAQREVADLVALPEPVVKKRLFRARQQLRRSLEVSMPEASATPPPEPLSFVRLVQFFVAVHAGDLAAIRRLLVAHPSLVDEQERSSFGLHARKSAPRPVTALYHAATAGDLALVRLLLGAGANPNSSTRIGQTPLHSAVLHDRLAVVELLLESGADPESTTNRGMTPLHWAVIRGRSAHMRLLLAVGASPDRPDAEGRTPRHWAVLKGFSLEPGEETE